MRRGIAFHIRIADTPLCEYGGFSLLLRCGHDNRESAEAALREVIVSYAQARIVPGPCPVDAVTPSLRSGRRIDIWMMRSQLRDESLPPKVRRIYREWLNNIRRRRDRAAMKRKSAARARTGRRR